MAGLTVHAADGHVRLAAAAGNGIGRVVGFRQRVGTTGNQVAAGADVGSGGIVISCRGVTGGRFGAGLFNEKGGGPVT